MLSLPLIHNERTSDAIQGFWKGLIVRSFIASKSNTYRKTVVRFGDHPRQKFSIYTPKDKPARPLKVVIYVHGGMFLNGSEEVFEYMGKNFVECGHILVVVGFRQLFSYGFYDSLYDVDTAMKKCIQIIPEYGGDNESMVVLTWSGGFNTTMPALIQDK